MKKLCMVFALVMGIVSASAQSSEKAAPYWWVGLQGGGAMTINKDYNNFKQITSTGTFSVGYMACPEVGVRANVNGAWAKSGLSYLNAKDGRYEYSYYTVDLDVLMNLCTIFGKKDYYPVNLYLIAGAGFNHIWDNSDCIDQCAKAPLYSIIYKDNDPRNNANFRAGLQLEANLSKHWSINIEGDMNYGLPAHSNYFVRDNWLLTAQVGVNYKFGFKKKAAPVPVAAPVATPAPAPKPAPKPAAAPAPKPTPKPAPAPEVKKINESIFYGIRGSQVSAAEMSKVEKIAAFMKENPSATVTVTGYADAGTGNKRINLLYSQQRAKQLKSVLVNKFGIASTRISTVAKGDAEQPFAENDKNRVSIVVGEAK